MICCGGLLKITLVVVVALMTVVAHGSAQEKVVSDCCKAVTNKPITEPILSFGFQQKSGPCVFAAIFQTANDIYCINPRAPWAIKKAKELWNKHKMRRSPSTTSSVPSSTPSLLSLIISTSSPPASPPPAFYSETTNENTSASPPPAFYSETTNENTSAKPVGQ